MSVLCSALVMYMCMSRNLSMAPPISLACSISSWDNRLMNHSNERWSRLIQKKSTYKMIESVEKIQSNLYWSHMRTPDNCSGYSVAGVIEIKFAASKKPAAHAL